MKFEWDEAKNLKNITKHHLSFERAVTIFAGLVLSTEDTRKHYGEMRYQVIGKTVDGVITLVVHTNRKGVTRIISARIANKRERRIYDDYCKNEKA